MKYGLILKLFFGTVLACIGIAAIVAGVLASRDSFVRSEPALGFFLAIILFVGVIALICAAAVLLWALGGMRRNNIARVVASVIAIGAGIASSILGIVLASLSYQSISGYITYHHHGSESPPLLTWAIFVSLTLLFFVLAKVFFVKAWKSSKPGRNGYIKTINALPTQNGEKPVKPWK